MGMRLSTGRRWRPVDNRTAPLPLAGRALPHFARARECGPMQQSPAIARLC